MKLKGALSRLRVNVLKTKLNIFAHTLYAPETLRERNRMMLRKGEQTIIIIQFLAIFPRKKGET